LIQYFVNDSPDLLERPIAEALALGSTRDCRFEWVSPLERFGFLEYRDSEFLRRLGLVGHARELARFWPRMGPCWDALAIVRHKGQRGALLVEAKSYPGELRSCGCQAGPRSREKIREALDSTKLWFGVRAGADWMGPLYQSANRLAHLYFLRQVLGVPAWLAHVCFVADPHSPTTEGEWRAAVRQAHQELGFGAQTIPFSASVFPVAAEKALSRGA
jgi:hypothetical protein